ncbi:DNA topoisomerase 1 [Chloropicon primus]|uniref:DNA topoisomerase n=1 Tax=Chloropicon primus TaxID=1764295 RepID=A0A5B8MN35_9CHLO|nr:DNA topoisomerase 1 [Chloropicon primus]|eukprot:QDZ21025.1 DNA topoisomerase 1 [Chloropicon primus]
MATTSRPAWSRLVKRIGGYWGRNQHQHRHLNLSLIPNRLLVACPSTSGGGDSGFSTLVVVESPTKAKKVARFLNGKGEEHEEEILRSLGRVEVLASYGHVRDLEGKPGAVDPAKEFELRWSVSPRAKPRLEAIKQAASRCDRILLATDPDREGEGIAWHLQEELEKWVKASKRGSKLDARDLQIERITFNEVTKQAVLGSLSESRDVSTALVDAYRARRALDHLVGFNLSPVLWRKLPGSKSAGRVQSAALRMICERDEEIAKFVPQEYWSVKCDLRVDDPAAPDARHTFEGANLVRAHGEKLGKFSLSREDEALAAARSVEESEIFLTRVKESVSRKSPRRPLTTSTLQQLASSRLGMSAVETMMVAQKLYEGDHSSSGEGLITYMRTDGTYLSPSFISSARAFVGEKYGEEYLPEKPRMFASKSKNAQEAHEAIRPTSVKAEPALLVNKLEPKAWKLYNLIWTTSVACQMSDTRIKTLSFEFGDEDASILLRSSASAVVFPGHQVLNKEKEEENKANLRVLESLSKLEPKLRCLASNHEPSQHFTSPPPKFSDGSLVKALEEEGIGRPSTYAPIIKVLTSRNYIVRRSGRLIPTARGHLVTTFLRHYFEKYVDYSYTSDMEEKLDKVSNNELDWTFLLTNFWSSFEPNVSDVLQIRNRVIIDELDSILGDALVSGLELDNEEENKRRCPSCGSGTLGLKLSRFGGFVGCSNYGSKTNECNFGVPLDMCFGSSKNIATHSFDPSAVGVVGQDGDGREIHMKLGPYGYYIQREDGRVASLPREYQPTTLTVEEATVVLNEKGKFRKTKEKKKASDAGSRGAGEKKKANPFIAFMQAEKDRVVKANPDKTWQECLKIIASEYKASASEAQ